MIGEAPASPAQFGIGTMHTESQSDLIDNDMLAAQSDAGGSGRTTRTIALVVAVVLLIAAAGLFAWVTFVGGDEDEQGLVFVIPAGSKTRIVPELQSAVDVPNDIYFGPGDVAKITVVNNDDVTHRAGPFLVAGGQTFTQKFDRVGEYPIACSVDPADSVVVKVEM